MRQNPPHPNDMSTESSFVPTEPGDAPANALAPLIRQLGASKVRTDLESRQQAITTWNPLEQKRRQAGYAPILPLAVVLPDDEDEVVCAMVWANETQTPITPMGGGSGWAGDHLPKTANSVVLDLSGLCNFYDLNETQLTVTCDAGCTVADVESRLHTQGYTLGHALQSPSGATVGGSIATNAVGWLSGRYGRFGDSVLHLWAVLPDGTRIGTDIDTGNDNDMGELRSLFVGRGGRFGVITRATLRVWPLPEARAWAVFRFDTLAAGLDALRLIYRTDSRPACARLLDKDSVQAQITRTDATRAAIANMGTGQVLLLLAFEGDELVQTGPYQMAHAVCQQVGGVEQNNELGEAWRPDDQDLAANSRPGTFRDTHILPAGWEQIETLYDSLRESLANILNSVWQAQITHPTPHGATVEATVTYTATTDADALQQSELIRAHANNLAKGRQ